MQPIAIIQNSRNDGPGLFETFIRQRGYPLRIFRRYDGDALPQGIASYAGLCVLGSPDSVNDDVPDFRHLEALILEARALRLPVIGHCFGGQLLARALGGAVTQAPHAEIGWSRISALSSEWFGEEHFPMIQWHYETFSLPPRAQLIARGELCAHQAFCVDDRHIGMQFHCEVDEAKLESWLDIEGCREIAAADSPGVQPADHIRALALQSLATSRRVAWRIYDRWSRYLRD